MDYILQRGKVSKAIAKIRDIGKIELGLRLTRVGKLKPELGLY